MGRSPPVAIIGFPLSSFMTWPTCHVSRVAIPAPDARFWMVPRALLAADRIRDPDLNHRYYARWTSLGKRAMVR